MAGHVKADLRSKSELDFLLTYIVSVFNVAELESLLESAYLVFDAIKQPRWELDQLLHICWGGKSMSLQKQISGVGIQIKAILVDEETSYYFYYR